MQVWNLWTEKWIRRDGLEELQIAVQFWERLSPSSKLPPRVVWHWVEKALHQYHTESLSVNSLGEAWPQCKYQWTPKCSSWSLPVNLTCLQHILLNEDLPGVLPLQDPLSTGAWIISYCSKYLSWSRSHFTGKETVLPMTMRDLVSITCNRVKT